MKADLYTVNINDKLHDLPIDMPIPRKGDEIFIRDKTNDQIVGGKVDGVRYHIINGELFQVSISTIDIKLSIK